MNKFGRDLTWVGVVKVGVISVGLVTVVWCSWFFFQSTAFASYLTTTLEKAGKISNHLADLVPSRNFSRDYKRRYKLCYGSFSNETSDGIVHTNKLVGKSTHRYKTRYVCLHDIDLINDNDTCA